MSETFKMNAANAGCMANTQPAADAGCEANTHSAADAGAQPAAGLCAEHAWREGIRPGGVVSRMIDATEEIWENCHRHPFVQGIADGSLDHEKFCFYMLQDYVYLFDYARVFAIGVAKAKDPEVMRIFANYVQQIMSGEMDIHRGYMKRLGISPEDAERTVPSLDNLSYTSYMIRIAYDDGAAEVAAAILSCALSYEAIAERMVAEHPGTPARPGIDAQPGIDARPGAENGDGHPAAARLDAAARPGAADHPFYGEWVQGYASPGYHAANLELIDLTERLAEGLDEARLQHLIDVFVNCSRYELLFWDMAWEMRS